MGMSNSRLAFSDCYELMEKAIEDQKGIRIKFATEQDAWLYRLRLHNARKIDRKDNEEIYEKGHHMHGKSVYDALIMRLRPVPNGTSQCWLRIEKISIDDLEIESLSEAEAELDEIAPPKVPMPLAIDIPTIIKVQPLPFKRRL